MKKIISHCQIEKFNEIKEADVADIHYGFINPDADIDLSKSRVFTKSFAIKISESDNYIQISSDWLGDTCEEALDCHEMKIELTNNVDFLNSNKILHKDNPIEQILSPCQLSLYEKRMRIGKIELYSVNEKLNEEEVSYDSSLVIHVHEKISCPVVIRCNPSISGGLLISVSQEDYKTVRDNESIRHTIIYDCE